MAQEPPSQARVVIIGGGIMGCGLAYHLAHEGWRDILLLEKAELTSGSTWHAAGQITQSTSSFTLGRCVSYNIGLYAGGLEAETGRATSWHGCGSIRLAYRADELDWLRHTLSVGRALGFNLELIDAAAIRALHPFYNLDGVLGGLHTPDDGHVDPSGVTWALADGARALGARIIRRCRATDIRRTPAGEWQVETERGTVTCEHVVNAGGTWARQIGAWSGLALPLTSMTHHYLVTEPVPEFAELDRELPVIRDDREVSGYIRMEQKAGLIGIYEKENPRSVWDDHCPWEAENELFAPDYERIMPWLENALARMPVLASCGIRRTAHGAISHPPDGNPLLGPAPGLPNYWCCCGVQIGIGWGPGLTRELARWMVHGAADLSMRAFDPRRYGAWAGGDWRIAKAREDYCLRHEVPFPRENRPAGRPVKPGPLYHTLQEKGAVFEEVYGHERPCWFARPDAKTGAAIAQRDHPSFRRTPVDAMLAQECRGVREAAGVIDLTAFAKIEVCGPDAGSLLDRLIANRLPQRDGGIALAHMLNRRGRIELEATITRLAPRRYYIVCAAFFEQRLLDHLAQHRGGATVEVINHSDAWAALALNGPQARAILAACCEADLSNAAFPWLQAREITVAGRQLWAFRMSYAGELGWELHMKRADAGPVYAALARAGAPHGLVDYGSYAMNVLRMEKAFPGAGELTNEVTLPEAGLMRFAKPDKGDFLGREALCESLAAAQNGDLPWQLCYLAIAADGVADGHGGEAVLHEGRVVGSLSSVAWAPATGSILAFAWLLPAAGAPGTELEIIIMGASRRGRVLGEAAYDPANSRPRTDAAC